MRILIGKTFGIGNACLAVPMVKSLCSMGHQVDVLVGSGPDDFGADVVFARLRETLCPEIHAIHRDRTDPSVSYDVAIMAIPFDGRWMNGIHYNANRVIDCRRRPGDVERLGFDMWEKHEVEYMMDDSRELGFTGNTPDGSFLERQSRHDPNLIYLGIGYKRDPGGFGRSKHFGNDRYVSLIDAIQRIRPETRFVSSGPMVDLVESGRWIKRGARASYEHVVVGADRFGLHRSFDLISMCHAYVGNDTGMMHVAASLGMPTMGLFAYDGLLRKNPPFCEKSRAILFATETSTQAFIDDLAGSFVDFAWRPV